MSMKILNLAEQVFCEEQNILNQLAGLVQQLEMKQSQAIQEWLKSTHPVDISPVLNELSPEQILAIYELMEPGQLAEVIEEAREEVQLRLIQLLSLKEIAHIFTLMSADNVTDILGQFKISEIKHLLKLMRDESAGDIRHLLGYPLETAGSIMTTEFIALKENLTVAQAWLKIKEIAPQTEVIDTIFVLDEVKRLVGTVALRDLIIAPNERILKEITRYNLISVGPTTDQEEVAHLVSRYDLPVIPVVNRKQALIGIITVDDILDVIERENSEDLYRMVGIRDKEQARSRVKGSIGRRLPWLLVNLGTTFLAAVTVGLFTGLINQVVALAVLLPVVAGMGGNAGLQTLAVMVRGMALGEISFRNSRKILAKEIALGLVHGAVLGLITGLIVYFWQGNPYLGLVIFLAMVANMLIAGISGYMIPVGLKAVGFDPALASSILLTTVTDVLGFLSFLLLASMFAKFLL